jgi:hypothetical protein
MYGISLGISFVANIAQAAIAGVLQAEKIRIAVATGYTSAANWPALPVIPFPMLFTRLERAMIGLVAQSHRINKHTTTEFVFGLEGNFQPLPGMYKKDTIYNFLTYFGINIYSDEDAAYLLDMVKNKGDIRPIDTSPWCSIEEMNYYKADYFKSMGMDGVSREEQFTK